MSLVLKASMPRSPFGLAGTEHWCRKLDGKEEENGLSPGQFVAAELGTVYIVPLVMLVFCPLEQLGFAVCLW